MPLPKRKLFNTYLIVYFLSILNLSHGQNNTSIKNAIYNYASWTYYKTDKPNSSINAIIEKYSSGQFKPLKQKVLNAGIANQYYWFHFTIGNNLKTEQSLIIDIDNAKLNELELFVVSDTTAQSMGKLGDFYLFSQRSIKHKNFAYQVSVQPGDQKDYFLFVNQVGHAFTLPVKIFTPENFSSASFGDYLSDGVTYGILLFVAVMSFLFFLTSKHTLYLYYGLYILTAILWFLSYFGLGYQYLWGNFPGLNTSMSPVMSSLNILLNLQICQVLLRLNKANKFLNSTANVAKFLLTAVALFPIFLNLNQFGYTVNHAYLITFLFIILLAMIIVLFSVFSYAIRGLIAARVYFFASMLKGCGIINLALLELGITPAIYNMEGFLQTGIFIEITLLTYALANRYTIFKVRSFEKVIEAHEKERFLISKEIHDCISNSLTGINYGIMNFTRGFNHLPLEKKLQLEKIYNELNKVQIEARNISHNTMPDYVKNSSIAEIISKYVEEVQSKAGNIIQINFSANEQLIHFSEAVKLNIFRIMQEIVTNILKHARATEADLLFSFDRRELVIIAEDNGIGLRDVNSEEKGMGLKNIRSRLELLEGGMLIHSPVLRKSYETDDLSSETKQLPFEYGTMIRIKIPYRDNLFKVKMLMIIDRKYKFIVIDDHPLIREGIISFISSYENFECVGQFAETRSLLNSNFSGKPDVIILDLNLPGIDGEKSCPLLKKKYPECKILAFTQYEDREKELNRLGFDGYLIKSERDSLIEAIQTVLKGGKFFNSRDKSSSMKASELNRMDGFTKLKNLTRREIEIAKYLVQDFSNREIGEKVFISESTVETHRKHIKEKLKAKNKRELYSMLREYILI